MSSDRLEGTRSAVGGLILKGNNKKTNQSPKKTCRLKLYGSHLQFHYNFFLNHTFK